MFWARPVHKLFLDTLEERSGSLNKELGDAAVLGQKTMAADQEMSRFRMSLFLISLLVR